MTDIKLPPLPPIEIKKHKPTEVYAFAQAYARQAVLIERERCAVIAATPFTGEQDDITMAAKDRIAAAIRSPVVDKDESAAKSLAAGLKSLDEYWGRHRSANINTIAAIRATNDALVAKNQGGVMNLRLDLYQVDRHAELVMRDLGITYQHATPQSMTDQWWFWNCQGVPTVLPPCLYELKMKPHDAIGRGLSKEDADMIAAGELKIGGK